MLAITPKRSARQSRMIKRYGGKDPDLMRDTVPFAHQHRAGPEHPASPSRARFRPAEQPADACREPAQCPFLAGALSD